MRRCLFVVAVAVVAALMPSSSPAANAFKVTISVKSSHVVIGNKVVLTGTITPQAVGQKVILQKRYSKKKPWSNVRTGKVATDGTYRLKDKPTSTKRHWYRVVKPASQTRSRGESKAVKVTVSKWMHLTDLEEGDAENVWEDAVTINGTHYSRSLYFYRGASSPGFIEYNISRKCSLLQGIYGLDDSSDTGSTGKVAVLADGALIYEGNFGVGQSEDVTIGTSGSFRLRFEFDYTSPDDGAQPAVGNPKVLCEG